MLRNIALGTYIPGSSTLHRLQARTKLLAIVWLSVASLIANQRTWHFTSYGVIVALACGSVALGSISVRFLWRQMRLLALLLLFGVSQALLFAGGPQLVALGPVALPRLLAFTMLLVYGGVLVTGLLALAAPLPRVRLFLRVRWPRWLSYLLIVLAPIVLVLLQGIQAAPTASIFVVGPLSLTYEGIWLATSISVVLLVLYLLALLFMMTTTPIALIEGLTRLARPLRRLRFPVDDLALMTLIALRFIPTLIDEVDQLVKAQTARGADFTHGALRERIQNFTTLFAPIMRRASQRAADLALALESRDYLSEGAQTALHETQFTRLDYAVLLVVILSTLGSFLL
jgi:energy-coupling factor transport system permease protein